LIRHLEWKPDFEKTIQRFAAWWGGEVIDRPPVSVWVAPRPYQGPISRHATLRDRWLDAEFAVESAIARMRQRDFVGDSIPILYPNVGPELTATILGCELEFSDGTSWSVPIVHDPAQWQDILRRPFDFDNIYWRTIERIMDLGIQRSEGRYIVGIAALQDSYNILAARAPTSSASPTCTTAMTSWPRCATRRRSAST
jgi:hypothetical protein